MITLKIQNLKLKKIKNQLENKTGKKSAIQLSAENVSSKMLQNDKRTSCLVLLFSRSCDKCSMSSSKSTGKELDPSSNSAAVSDDDGLYRAPTSDCRCRIRFKRQLPEPRKRAGLLMVLYQCTCH